MTLSTSSRRRWFTRSKALRSTLQLICVGVLMLPGTASLLAQNPGKISGVVKDATTGELLLGCNISIVGTNQGASSDQDGSFFILNIPAGEYDLQASLIGYQRVLQRGVVVNSGRTTTANFRLTSTTIQQQEVVIEASRPDVELEKTSTSAIVRAEDVQTIAGIRNVGDVLGLAADVTDGHFRGGRENEEYYTLQGMGIVNPLDNTSAFLPIMSAVEEVEVITSGFGAQYGNAQSGVVNISMKEGKSDRWRTRVESRMRAPNRKHFGPSVFDPGANTYLALLLNRDVWLRGDPNSDNAQPYFGSMGSGLTSRYGRDTLVQVAVAQALWSQMRPDLNKTYGQGVDYSVEMATGGPLNEEMRMFVALRANREWPVFPTEEPDVDRQVMGNLAIDLSGSSALRLSGGFTQENTSVFPSVNGVGGYQRWLWDRITGINYNKQTNLQLGARFTETLNPSTFYELKLNTLITRTKRGATPVPSSIPDSAAFQSAVVPWSFILPVPSNNSPDGIDYMAGYDVFRNEETRTITFEGSLTSQVTKSHLVNAGVQVNGYLIKAANVLNLRGNDNIQNYSASPFESAIYIQDKMEFEGMIANAGLRWDLWSSGTDYYTNAFTPFLTPDTLGIFHPETAPTTRSPIHARLQPRVGVSFPVSVNTVFHLNYGAFMQRPPFQYVVSTQMTQAYNTPVTLGNPRLQPEVTNSYDIGATQGLGSGFTLDVSGYYKDVKNLIEEADFKDIRTGQEVTSYFNRDYADIRGFRVALSKRRGALTGSINYQFGVATGKSATVSSAVPLFRQDTTGAITTDLSGVPTRDITLDFDRTHNLIVTIGYVTEEGWGPGILGGTPFEGLTLSAISRFRSGRPYTSPADPKNINASRTPWEYNTDMRLTKRIADFFGAAATFYVEVFNLFDQRTLNYDYIFRKPTQTDPNLALTYYETYKDDLDNPEGPRYWYDKARQGPFSIDQSFLIYENMPRSFNFGVAIEL